MMAKSSLRIYRDEVPIRGYDIDSGGHMQFLEDNIKDKLDGSLDSEYEVIIRLNNANRFDFYGSSRVIHECNVLNIEHTYNVCIF